MNHGKGNSPWPDGNVQMLRSLWAEGLSASQIAEKMNKLLHAGLTRNAVIAKVHRLGLSRRKASTGARRSRKGLARSKPKVNMVPAFKVESHEPKGALRGAENIPWKDHSRGQCEMFCEGEEGFEGLVCGRETLPGKAWCSFCEAVVYDRSARAKRAVEREAA